MIGTAQRRSDVMNEHEQSVFEAMVKEAGRQIDPATAIVAYWSVKILEPYGIHHEEEHCIGRQCFARAPGGDVWALFDDLPEATREALSNMPYDDDPLGFAVGRNLTGG